jgi:hypothetical protein
LIMVCKLDKFLTISGSEDVSFEPWGFGVNPMCFLDYVIDLTRVNTRSIFKRRCVRHPVLECWGNWSFVAIRCAGGSYVSVSIFFGTCNRSFKLLWQSLPYFKILIFVKIQLLLEVVFPLPILMNGEELMHQLIFDCFFLEIVPLECIGII